MDFEAVYIAERSKLLRYLIALKADPHEADDAVHTAFAQAYEVWDTLRNPRAWLYKVARREYYRADAKVSKREVPSSNAILDRAEPLSSGDLAEFNEEARRVQAVLDSLPTRQREVMGLDIAGFTDAEIAEQLDCDRAAVRQSRRKARDNLARRLGLNRRKTS